MPFFRICALGVAFGNVDTFDTNALHQPGPCLARPRLGDGELQLYRDVEQRLLDDLQDTIPGLALQQLTAVTPPGRRRRNSRMSSRSA
jgi:hypothetical protein